MGLSVGRKVEMVGGRSSESGSQRRMVLSCCHCCLGSEDPLFVGGASLAGEAVWYALIIQAVDKLGCFWRWGGGTTTRTAVSPTTHEGRHSRGCRQSQINVGRAVCSA